jgi:DNA-binding Lrp family transcriptional regulator
MAEIPTSVFGFSRFVVVVKFRGATPNFDDIKNELEKNPFVHIVFTTKGSYDLFMIVIAENTLKLESLIYNLRTSAAFSNHRSVWHVSYLGVRYGFMPLGEEFFTILKERIWQKSRETPSKLPNQLLEREYYVLKELGIDGSQEFAEIDKKHGFGKGASQYTYHKLLDRGMINRITIAMQNPPVKYVAILHLDQVNMRRFADSRKGLFLDRIRYIDAPLNRYVLAGDFGSPYGILLVAPVFEDSGLYNMEKSIKESVKGIKIRTSVITGVLVGSIGFRKFGNRYSEAYTILKERYGYSDEELERVINNPF